MAKKTASTATKRPRKVAGVKKAPKASARKVPPTGAAKSIVDHATGKLPDASVNGAAAVAVAKGKADLDPNQKQIPGFEEDRVPAVEKILKSRITRLAEISKLQEENKADTAKLPGLFKKHKLSKYTAAGLTASIVHGPDEVVFKKAKANK